MQVETKMRHPSLGTITKSAVLCLVIVLIIFVISLKNPRRRRKFFLELANDRVNKFGPLHNRDERNWALFMDRKKAQVKPRKQRKPNLFSTPIYFRKPLPTDGANCEAVCIGKPMALIKAKQIAQKTKANAISNNRYKQMTRDCANFKAKRQYITNFLTQEEKAFPLAYSIMMFQSVYQTELLLRAVYRPQNFYCIHVDKKSPNDMKQTLTSIARCFNNVFVVSYPIEVTRGTLSVLNADLKCLQFLMKYANWRYFINLSAHHFPLKTNYEIVKILKALDGSNDVEGLPVGNKFAQRPPNGLVPYTGTESVILSRPTAKYVVMNPVAKRFLTWARARPNPHLLFFATINYNPQNKVKGTYKGPLKVGKLKSMPHIMSFVDDQSGNKNFQCHGMRVRKVCVFGIGDLPELLKRKELFAYKFKWDYQHIALKCLAHAIHEKSKKQFEHPKKFDDSYYEKLPFVKQKF